MSPTAPKVTEKTFTSYNEAQGQAYAAVRRQYHPSVYETILSHHQSTGGAFNTLLDVGCGPGLALSALAPKFSHAIGLDPSEGMIQTARSLNANGVIARTSTSEPARFEISTAEDLGRELDPPIPDGSVDLLTASNAAHWFNMAGFWPSAARVLKPGGSVALWCSGELRVHPSTPGAETIQKAMDEIRGRELTPYYVEGNLLTLNRYRDLPLPWTLSPPVAGFEESTFFRKEWTVGEQFFVGELEVDLETFEKMLATGSPVTRWREAHPKEVGTEGDVVRMLRRQAERILRENGVEPGQERIKGTALGAMLIVKKAL
ncbi:hypothetical protein M433DRAFT_157361 [Acidomyces richmondensis BFW]|nr:MAG: hypothetical protein FE78DRAFT_94724 [Acidomyces sp. 'richmondensis']KYG42890.1 hypothetical protein M433DRAFT_157361 [Acidomyces richmondensis BFW]